MLARVLPVFYSPIYKNGNLKLFPYIAVFLDSRKKTGIFSCRVASFWKSYIQKRESLNSVYISAFFTHSRKKQESVNRNLSPNQS